MNKIFRSIAIVATIVIAFGAVGSVFAQGPGEAAFDGGFWGGRGGHGLRGEGTRQDVMDGEFHDAFLAAYAEALDISAADLQARIEAGESMADIALAEGLTIDVFRELMQDVRNSVFEQAVSDGTLTEEQATWMAARGAGKRNGQPMGGRGIGSGNCPYGETTD